jgi:hypothetical protein
MRAVDCALGCFAQHCLQEKSANSVLQRALQLCATGFGRICGLQLAISNPAGIRTWFTPNLLVMETEFLGRTLSVPGSICSKSLLLSSFRLLRRLVIKS